MTRAARWTKHRPLAYKLATEFFVPGMDRDDVNQEALVALWVATGDYDQAKGTFPPFARLVIRRRLVELVRQSQRSNHRALNEAGEQVDVAAPEPTGQLALVVDALPSLSELERHALARSLSGEPVGSKQHDNALQRARRKLRAAA